MRMMRSLGFFQACPELPGCFTVTKQAERTKIIQIALTSAFCHGKDVVCVPETLSTAFDQAPVSHELDAVFATGMAKTTEFLHRIDAAARAYTLVPKKHLFTEIGGL